MSSQSAPGGAMAYLDVLQAWTRLMTGSLRGFTQPILPGWTFNIDSDNSSSPQTEADVVAQVSYGKQLGRINDALALLIDRREAPADSPAFVEFEHMRREVHDAKVAGARRRLERAAADLSLLRTADRAEYDRLSAALRAEMGTSA